MRPEIAAALAAALREPCTPAPLHLLDRAGWQCLAEGDAGLDLLGLFVSGDRAHALFAADGSLVFVGTEIVEGTYPALSPGFPAAAWFERRAFDLTRIAATGAVDTRPAIAQPGGDAGWPRFIETAGEGLYQIGTGPVSGLIARPVHRRYTMDGARIARLEHRLGYAHRDIVGLMRGKSPRAAARYAARVAGDATVAHAVAFARAAEAASAIEPPPRAMALRAAMLAIEQATAALAALAALAEAATHLRLAGILGRARDAIAEAAEAVFGHRLMMDLAVPGGLAADIRAEALPGLAAALKAVGPAALRLGSWRARRDLGTARAPVLARARTAIAQAEVASAVFGALPDGIIAHAMPAASGMGIGAAASGRGMVHHWVRLADGQIGDMAILDPTARLIPRLEAAAMGMGYEEHELLAICHGLSVSEADG